MNRLQNVMLVSLRLATCLSFIAMSSTVFAIPSLLLHFDADDVLENGGSSTPNDGDPLPVWKDLAGTNDAMPGLINPGNPTNPPLYRNAPAGPLSGTSLMLNGKPTVQFGFNVNNGTGMDSPFVGSRNAHPQMTVVWVGAGDVVNDYHPFWTFDGSTGGHHRSSAMWAGMGSLPGTPVVPIQYDPCCGDAIFLKNNDGLDVDGGGPRIQIPANGPILNGDATWHVFAVRYDFPNKFELTVDGKSVLSPANEQIPGPDMNHMLALGYLPAGGGKGNNLRMLLSDFRIYGGKLNNEELNAVGSALASEFNLLWTPIPPIPEPATLAMLVSGLAMCATRRYRKR
jgi:hypothetical protein